MNQMLTASKCVSQAIQISGETLQELNVHSGI